MTDISGDQADAALPPFEQWLEAARPKTQLWRTIIGVIIVVVVWALWTAALGFGWSFSVTLAAGSAEAGLVALDDLATGATTVGTMLALATFLGMWFGVWVALRFLHGRGKFWPLVSASGRISWREFGIGVLLIAGYALAGGVLYALLGLDQSYRSEITLADWLLILAPMTLLLFMQSSGEEIFFRGYLMRNLAARSRSPLVWGLAPALAFGLLHYANGTFPEFSNYYVLATTLFALTATATVWRTGGLSVAMGMHTANNFLAFMISGSSESMYATPLYLTSVTDLMQGAPLDMLLLAALLAFTLSPWAPLPKRQLFARRNEIRAAP